MPFEYSIVTPVFHEEATRLDRGGSNDRSPIVEFTVQPSRHLRFLPGQAS